MNFFAKIIFGLSVVLLNACATTLYTTHYGVFTAENSAGDARQVRIYWQTAEIEGWDGKRYRALPFVLETQCSDRILRFYDQQSNRLRGCLPAEEGGIAYCGNASLDTDPRGLPIDNGDVCATVTDRSGATNLLELDGDVLISLACQPKETRRQFGRKFKNQDYLKPSVTPYVVATRRVSGKDVNSVAPTLSSHSSICDPGRTR